MQQVRWQSRSDTRRDDGPFARRRRRGQAFLLNQSSPYGISAVFPLAPTDVNRAVVTRVPLAVLLPYGDGDVFDLQGVHYYDDARYNVAGDDAPKHTILVMGGNHNFYNTVWTPGVPDGHGG